MKRWYGVEDDLDMPVSDGRIKAKMKPQGIAKMGRTPPDHESRYRIKREKEIRKRKRNN